MNNIHITSTGWIKGGKSWQKMGATGSHRSNRSIAHQFGVALKADASRVISPAPAEVHRTIRRVQG